MKQDAPAGGFLHELGWLGMGFVMPFASLAFYRHAARRRVIWAVLFFLIFSLALTGVMSLSLARGMSSMQADVRGSFARSNIPSIVIQNGVARVDGAQTRVLVDEAGTIVMIDMTGTYRQLDRTRYRQGFLLTRTELHIMDNSGRYQVIPLAELQEALNADPIVIDAETVARAWQTFADIFAVVAIVLVAVWNVLVRFVYLAALALVAWGLVSMGGSSMSYGSVLAIGIYAAVPTLYLGYLLGRSGISFIFLQTLILLFIWAIALWAATVEAGEAEAPAEQPLHGWRALIGIPLVVLLAVDSVFHLSYGPVLVWAATLMTVGVLLAIGLWVSRRSAGQGPADGAGPAPVAP